MKFTIGTDSEILLHDGYQFVSSIGLLGATKDKPCLTKYGNVQEDNVLAEFATNPCEDLETFKNLIKGSINYLKETLNPLNLIFDPAAYFNEHELVHPKANEFACETDYNAWTGKENKIDLSDNYNLRTAGGHIHVGHESLLDIKNKIKFIKLCDMYLGVPGILYENQTLGHYRRILYGKAGAFRPKSYGVEYRTLSNFWIIEDSIIEFVYKQIEKTLELLNENIEPVDCQNIINNHDLKSAEKFIKEYNIC